MSSTNGSPDARLARRLRELREHEWPEATLTQVQLAHALSAQNKVASATLSTWENISNPKIPTTARLSAYARFFATRRSLEGPDGEPHLIAVDDLAEDERKRFKHLEEELFRLHTSLGEVTPEDRRLLLSFDGTGPIVIVCPDAPEDAQGPLADQKDPNHTRLHQYADADALLEVFGHIRALNPDREVPWRLASDAQYYDLQNHLVILGGIGWNLTLRRIQAELKKRLPVTQVEDSSLSTGEVFEVRKSDSDKNVRYFPVVERNSDGVEEVTEDLGLIARLSNPFNSSRTLTIFNGVHSRGVVGAVLALTDARVREANERYLARHHPNDEFAILVRVPIIAGSALAPDLQIEGVRVFEWTGGTA